MAWFKFIIYFQLFANAAGNLIIAFMWITGLHYGESAGLYYEVCPPLKAVDVIYGLICIACAVGAILVRQKLAELMRYAVIVIVGVCFHIPLNYVYFIKRKDLFVN